MIKYLSTIICLFAIFANTQTTFSAPTQSAKQKTRIALIIKTDQFTLSPKSKNYLAEKLSILFPAEKYQIIEDQNMLHDFDALLHKHLLSDPAALEKSALLQLNKKYNYDATILLFYRFNKADDNNNFLDWKKEVYITLKTRMVDSKTNDYTYKNDTHRKGQTPLKTIKDLSDMNDTITESTNLCTEHLFSPLELPVAKRTLELS